MQDAQDAVHNVVRATLSLVLIGLILESSFPSPAWGVSITEKVKSSNFSLMPRAARVQPGKYVVHVINRGNGRMTIFADESDYTAFKRVIPETMEQKPMRLRAYCPIPNHWHVVLRPREDCRWTASVNTP